MASISACMTTPEKIQRVESRSVWDPRSQYRFVAACPAGEPELWSTYLEGALGGYRKYGAENALDYERTRDGGSTALFFVAIGGDGCVAGGLRAQGPYQRVEQAHATVEWAGHPGATAVRTMIADRIPFGVVEMKAAWVADGVARRTELTRSLAGIGCCTLEILDVQFLLATAAEHVLQLWASSGGEVARHIPPAPYPDDRYRTRMMWWDRRNRQNLGVKGASQFNRMRAPWPKDDDDESVRLHRSN
ncbi:hypothetical protein [Rhodococcus maanshanensis]|uniref:N-acetyltransferase domain-containing protein n=1 Tax=Rhodococcus maanshanensis TaxID=183556 RepID=A0A1H7MNR4_9NOCA|nr:hypothetical protein [Rhodococcus maanshanensis]SEL12814.1 hypothetical protein SAMN05444583_10687 [Rhodococcus maanshanensis]